MYIIPREVMQTCLENTGLHKASRVEQSYSACSILYISMLQNSMVHTDSAINNLLLNVIAIFSTDLMNISTSIT